MECDSGNILGDRIDFEFILVFKVGWKDLLGIKERSYDKNFSS